MAVMGALESIRGGVTTVVEYTGGIGRSAEALANTGLRWVFAESIRDVENGAGPLSAESLARSEAPRFSPAMRDEGLQSAHDLFSGSTMPSRPMSSPSWSTASSSCATARFSPLTRPASSRRPTKWVGGSGMRWRRPVLSRCRGYRDRSLLRTILMKHSSFRLAASLLVLMSVSPLSARELAKLSIAEINAQFESGEPTSERLIELALLRIEAFDDVGPELNAIITLNPNALERARALDAERKSRGPRSPLHGIPVVLKDNFDTSDMATTGGSFVLAGSLPPDDAFLVKKLRDAGAIILAKTNMSELASGDARSSLGGVTRNPTTRCVPLPARPKAQPLPLRLATFRWDSVLIRAVQSGFRLPRTGLQGFVRHRDS